MNLLRWRAKASKFVVPAHILVLAGSESAGHLSSFVIFSMRLQPMFYLTVSQCLGETNSEMLCIGLSATAHRLHGNDGFTVSRLRLQVRNQ